MDITQALKNAENDLRNLTAFLLEKNVGADWIKKCGVSQDRINKWIERQDIEKKRLGTADLRILYYADFYDLQTIINKNWEIFKIVFKNKKEFEALYAILDELRNPEAHRRDFLPHQVHLAIGISGKIRSQITEFFSTMETSESYYPRIESIRDNLGNSWTIGMNKSIQTSTKLRPGSVLELVISAFDPLDGKIFYNIKMHGSRGSSDWQDHGNFILEITEHHIRRQFLITVEIKSDREYHAISDSDDIVNFLYEVLPPLC